MNINSLYRAAERGDKKAEQELFSLLAVRFRLFANQRIWNQQDAEDVVQNALLTVSKEYREIAISVSFSAWAYKVLDNRILSYINCRKERAKESLDDLPEIPAADCRPDDSIFETRLLDCVRRVRKTNAKYGRAVILHYQGYTAAEICESLGVTRQNFYMILSRARAMLKRCLENGEMA